MAGPALFAQGTQADYDRALGLRKKYEALVGNAAEAPRWIGRTHKLYYRRAVKGGHDFILVDADTKAKGPAFDHAAIAASLSSAAGKTYGALDLPFNAFDFVDNDRAIQFIADGTTWRCDIATSACRKATPAEAAQGGGGRGGRGGGGGQGNAAFAGRGRGEAPPTTRPSPDGTKEALIWNYNVQVRDIDTGKNEIVLSTDGSEGDRLRAQLDRLVARLEEDRRLPRPARLPPRWCTTSSRRRPISCSRSTRCSVYAKPGDAARRCEQPVIFDLAGKQPDRDRQRALSQSLRPVALPVAQGQPRLHLRIQPARSPGLSASSKSDAATGKARAVIAEEPKTFFDYRTANGNARRLGQAVPLRRRRRQGNRSGCRSATAGIISTSTTARPAA